MQRITIIRSTNPATVCKRYTPPRDGGSGYEKTAVAHITEGVGKGVDVPDAETMVRVLQRVTSQRNLVLVSGAWNNDTGKPFRVVDERKLADLLGGEIGRVPGGVIEHNGELISARLKRGIEPSAWILIDADNPPGMPAEWARMSIGERLELWDKIIPGISKAERIELRGSSARLLNGSGHKAKTHAWVQVNKPENIALMKAWIGVEIVNKGLSFAFEKKSRITPDKTVGIEARSVFDLAVFDTGRIVFCSEPEIEVPGYTLDDAGIEIVNAGGGQVDIAWMTTPTRAALSEYKTHTGIELEIKVNPGAGLSVVAQGVLKRDTEITVKGATKTLDQWVADIPPGGKLRCESPFRESHSEAGFIRVGEDWRPFVHDVGNGTTYTLMPEPIVFSATAGGQEGNGGSNGGDWDMAGVPTPDWENALIVTAKGNLVANPENLRLFMLNHEGWDGVLAYDEFMERTMVLRPLPGTDARGFKQREMMDHDACLAVAWFNRNGFPTLTSEFMVDSVMKAQARLNTIHQVRHYLDVLVWDGQPRIDTWLQYYCAATPSTEQAEYTRQVGAKFFLSAVARIFRPGCKVDSALILEGEQGVGKSTAIQKLCGADHFGDNLPSMSSKDASSYIRGKWIVELGELSAMQRNEVEIVKAFISRTEERFRPAYGRNEVRYPRQCVFAGTTNRSDFLRDETGNRRFWPVKVGKVDLARLEADRDQLWAEAVSRFNAGENWWLEGEVLKVAATVQEDRVQEDAWLGTISNYLAGRFEASITDIAVDGIGVETGRVDTSMRNRILGVLTSLGWSRNGRFMTRNRNRDAARYVPPSATRSGGGVRGVDPNDVF